MATSIAPHQVSFPALRLKQPIGEFFIGVMKSSDLYSVSYADVRRIEKEREIETYLGIQRPLSVARVKELQSYVKTADATFPTAVILAVSGVSATWDETTKVMTLSAYDDANDPSQNIPFEQIAKILDGQHRVEGLANYPRDDFEVNVTIFVDADIAEQANIFATVNLAQTKVNRSLVFDLYELAKTRSPQKSGHNVAVALDRTDTSPFYKRIKRLGVATDGRFNETLTQATVVDAILKYTSSNPMEDRDKMLRGITPPLPSTEESRRYIFREWFIKEKEVEIARLILDYFNAVRKKWPNAWTNFERGNILIKTNGFRAFMRFLRPAYLNLMDAGTSPSEEAFSLIFQNVGLGEQEFRSGVFLPGSSGESALYRRLTQETGIGN